LLRDGDFFFGRRYDLREFATVEGEALRQHYLADGWIDVPMIVDAM
jgi:hypothetical protein